GHQNSPNGAMGLVQVLQMDPDPWVRWRAAKALGVIGDERAVEPLTREQQDRDANVRKMAQEMLTKLCSSKKEI
ncbi:MAG: HEAT repeat domain-containing protein, partial [Candidatus Hodarchaeota archaeon]